MRHPLVALPPVRDLIICAKHLFVAAMAAITPYRARVFRLLDAFRLATGNFTRYGGVSENLQEQLSLDGRYALGQRRP